MAGAVVLIMVAVVGFAATGCGGATSTEPSAGTSNGAAAPDAASTAGGGATTDGAASDGPCGAPSPRGPTVTIANVATNAPAATGGTILPGTYDLTLDVFHLGADADPATATTTQMSRAETLEVTFGAYQTATVDAKGVSYESGTYSDDGAKHVMNASCPATISSTSLTFSSTPDEIHLFRGAGCIEELVFRRRAGS